MWKTGGRPIDQQTQVPEGTPKWGSAWKQARAENYLSAMSIATHGSVMSYRDSYLDLDPTYRDIYGNPLLRMTFDFHDNEHKMSRFLTDKAALIAQAMKPRSIKANYRDGPLLDRALPDDAQHRRRGDGRRSEDQRRQPLPAVAGTCRTCSSWARACSRRTPATTRPARSARSPSGPPTRSAASTCKRPGPLVQA